MGKYVGLKALNMGFDAHLTVHYVDGVGAETLDKVAEYIDSRKNFATKVFRTGIKLFGYRNIPVMTVSILPELQRIKDDLSEIVESQSEYKWNPHVTLKLKQANTITLPPEVPLVRLDIYD